MCQSFTYNHAINLVEYVKETWFGGEKKFYTHREKRKWYRITEIGKNEKRNCECASTTFFAQVVPLWIFVSVWNHSIILYNVNIHRMLCWWNKDIIHFEMISTHFLRIHCNGSQPENPKSYFFESEQLNSTNGMNFLRRKCNVVLF